LRSAGDDEAARALFLSNTAEERAEALDIIPRSLRILHYAKFRSRSHHALIRLCDDTGNMIETHEHAGEFKEP
jgi:hypothetical protein